MLDINNLKKIRQSLGLTQFELARKAGVSQSLIAKIESQKLDPTYSNVKKLEEAINNLSNIHEKTSKDVMNTKLIFIHKYTKIGKIKELMLKNGISNIPVIEHGNVIGMVTERSLLHNEEAKTAEEAMIESCPIVSKSTSLKVIKSLLNNFNMVIVLDKGEIVGVITTADLI